MAAQQTAQRPGSVPGPVTTAPPRVRRPNIILLALRHSPAAMIGVSILVFLALIAIVGPYVAPYDPTKFFTGPSSAPPSSSHWLGTTQLGQDIFSQLLVGTRSSLTMAVFAGLLTNLIAVVVGLTAGYARGWIDDILTTLTNVFLIIPALPLLILISTYANALGVRGTTSLAVVVALVGWPWGARAFRGQMLSLRSRDFVLAAKVTDESRFRIIFSEIMPNMLSIIVANIIFATIAALVAEVGLEFIGLGDTSLVTWGTMLYWAQTNAALLNGAWYWFVPPGLAIGLFAVGLVLTNYVIDEIANPRLRTERATPAPVATVPAVMQPEVESTSSDSSIA
jgi:peptide/nickel transport system permease protein